MLNLVSSPCLHPASLEKIAYISFFIIFAVQNYVKNLKNVLFACSNITSQVGISSPRV